MAIMYVKYQFAKNNQQFPQVSFPALGWFADVPQNVGYAGYIAYANGQHWFDDFVTLNSQGLKQFKPNAFVAVDEILRLMNLPVLSGDAVKIKRGEFAHLLVRGTREGLFAQASTSTPAVAIQQSSDAQGPILNSDQVLSTIKTLFAFTQ